jgi:hypothetical protein
MIWRGPMVTRPLQAPLNIAKILTHLDNKAALSKPVVQPQSRAPPQGNLFD